LSSFNLFKLYSQIIRHFSVIRILVTLKLWIRFSTTVS